MDFSMLRAPDQFKASPGIEAHLTEIKYSKSVEKGRTHFIFGLDTQSPLASFLKEIYNLLQSVLLQRFENGLRQS
jgi:hypothetical protein